MMPPGWDLYGEAVHRNIVDGLEVRSRLIRWRAFVAQTHKDRYTLATLDRWIMAGPWRGRFQAWENVERELAQRC